MKTSQQNVIVKPEARFFLTRKTKVADCVLGEDVVVLADFSGIAAGTRGVITENYETGVMVTWLGMAHTGTEITREGIFEAMKLNRCFPAAGFPSDGFGEDELEYLAFGTLKHPTRAK